MISVTSTHSKYFVTDLNSDDCVMNRRARNISRYVRRHLIFLLKTMKLCVPSSHTAAEVWGDQGHLWELQTLTMDHFNFNR